MSALQAVVLGGSAGSVGSLLEILPALPADFPPVLVVIHVLRSHPTRLVEVFGPRCAMRVVEAASADAIESGTIVFAPADYHLLVERERRCSLSIEAPVHFSRPSIDVLFESASEAYGPGLAAMVLTGANEDGAAGLAAVHAAGGHTFVQDPATSFAAVMPAAALAAVPSARVGTPIQLAAELIASWRATS